MDPVIKILIEAYTKAREASFQSHTGHWNREQPDGTTACSECIRSRALRKEAEDLFDRAMKLREQIK